MRSCSAKCLDNPKSINFNELLMVFSSKRKFSNFKSLCNQTQESAASHDETKKLYIYNQQLKGGGEEMQGKRMSGTLLHREEYLFVDTCELCRDCAGTRQQRAYLVTFLQPSVRQILSC